MDKNQAQIDQSTLSELKKYIKYEKRTTNNHCLEKCLYELHLNIIQAMIIKKKMEKRIIVLRLKRMAVFAVTCFLTVVAVFMI